MRYLPRSMVAPLIVGVTYCLLAAGAIVTTRLSGGIALLWVADAPLTAALCVLPASRHRAVILAAALASIVASMAFSPWPLLAPLFAPIAVGEGVLAAALLRRWGVNRSALDGSRSIALFVIGAGVIAPVVSGVAAASLLSAATPLAFRPALIDWVIGHGVGAIIATPLAMQMTRRDIDWPAFHARHGTLKAIAAIALLIGTTAFVFLQSRWPLLFLTVVPLLIGTFAFQRFGAAIGIVIVAIAGGIPTIHGTGPAMLIHGSDAVRLQFFQFYLVVLLLTALPVAGTLVQRDRLLAALGESEARYRMLADHATDIMLTLDPDGTIRYASPAVRELGRFEPGELIGRNAVTLVHRDDRERVAATHLAALAAADRTFNVEHRAVKANGEIGWFETNTRAVRDANGHVTAVISVIRDHAQHKAREAELERAATTDPLTGLLNRNALRQRVKDALALAATGRPSTLALLDLDHFKLVNDTHGHAAGDATLLMLADLLRAKLRPEDAVGRVGGEEFAILFSGLPLAGAAPVCERLRAALAGTIVPLPDAAPIKVTASIGLSPVAAHKTIDAVFGEADAALYTAKARGRDRVEVAAA